MFLATLVALSFGQAPTDQRSVYSRPDIHGNQVVFTCEGDLWLGDIIAQTANRLTRHAGLETNAKFSPDGKSLAFQAALDGKPEVYVMPVAGGAPTRLTAEAGNVKVLDWTQDGQSVLYATTTSWDIDNDAVLKTVPATGGVAKKVAVPRGWFGTFLADGRLAYVPVSNEWANWYRYKGGAADQIWITDLRGGFRRLTRFEGVNTTPVAVGRDLYFVSEQPGVTNLAKLDPDSGRTEIVTKNTEYPVKYPGADDRRVVFEAGPFLALYDPADGSSRTLRFALTGDRLSTRPYKVPVGAFRQDFGFGPTGRRVALATRGSIVTVPVEHGESRTVYETAGARGMSPAWSPDGKTIAFVSDATGENEIYLSDANGGPARKLTSGIAANLLQLRWAPDGKHLAAFDRNGRLLRIDAVNGAVELLTTHETVGSYDSLSAQIEFSPDGKSIAYSALDEDWSMGSWVIDVAAKEVYRLTDAGNWSMSPTFSPDGRYVAVAALGSISPQWNSVSRRQTFTRPFKVRVLTLDPAAPSPFAPESDQEKSILPAPDAAKPAEEEKKPAPMVDLAGARGRIIEAPIPADDYTGVHWLDGRLLLAKSSDEQTELLTFDLKEKELKPLLGEVQQYAVSADRKRLLIRRNNALFTLDLAGPPEPKPVVLSGTVNVDPVAEWRQIFTEAWRVTRDFFYDPGMHGVNWDAVRKKYEARLPMVGDRSDLTQLLKDMVSELDCGHAYVTPVGATPPSGPPRAYLGADFVADGQGVKIARILTGSDVLIERRSPLASPGDAVQVGEYLVAINGRPVRPNDVPEILLEGLAGRTVALRLNAKPGLDGSREIRVVPLDSEILLRYTDLINQKREYVRKNAGDNFGYLHVPDMVDEGMRMFVTQQFPTNRQDAVVVDFRANSGGNISSLIVENFLFRSRVYFHVRSGRPWRREDWSFVGHLAALCNEYNFSDGELVLDSWQRNKLGPVIGMRTGGGEVGSGGGYGLVDGGSIYVPNYAAYADNRWIIEGVGAVPDITVAQDPAAAIQGKDPQLDRAIAYLKEKLAREPVLAPRLPPFPIKN
jgi:tricorn protease